jgi:hypothetical protein
MQLGVLIVNDFVAIVDLGITISLTYPQLHVDFFSPSSVEEASLTTVQVSK